MENRTGISPKDLEIRCADRIGGTSASGASFVSISPPRAGLLDAALLPCNRCKGFHDRCKGLHRTQTVYACVQRAGPGSRRPPAARVPDLRAGAGGGAPGCNSVNWPLSRTRSEEHSSELQPRDKLVC